MDVQVEVLGGLERKLTIKVPNTQVEEALNKKIKEMAPKARISGFRPGKVPPSMIKKRYGEALRGEVIGDLMRQTLPDALKQENLNPASVPQVDVVQSEKEKPLEYVVTFEVYPEITINAISELELEKISASVSDEDLTQMIEKIRKQQTEWKEVTREAQTGDQVLIDFEGTVDGNLFEGNTAKDYTLELGSRSMISGFEEGLIGAKAGDERNLDLQFPQDYRATELAGKSVIFKVNVHKVLEAKLPELDDTLAAKLAVDGGLEGLRQEVRKNMEHELDRAVKFQNREHVFSELLKKNRIELPKALIKEELKSVMQRTKQLFKMQTGSDEMPEGRDEEFQQLAKRRVELRLLIGEFVKVNDIKADQVLVRKMIDDLAAAYYVPDDIVKWYYQDKKRYAEIESAAIEQQVVDKILEGAKVIEKSLSYEEVMNKQSKQQEEK